MQINIDGVWTEAPDSTPQVLPWDQFLPYTDRQGDNQGCPPGYFCEYVAGTWGATTRVCRRFDQQISSTPQILVNETAPGWMDQTTINVADAAKAIVSAALPVGLLLALGLGAFLLLGRR